MATNLAKRFGVYDYDPVVWNDVEAWVLTNGVWHKADAFQMINQATILSAAEFAKQFPSIERTLPKEAFASH
jgi:hypothetical protein